MRIALFFGHPAHFHMLKHVAANLKEHGHQVFFVIKKKDILETLCQDAGFEYFKIREGRGGSKIGLVKSVLCMEWHMWQFLHRNKIDILVGSTLSFTAAKINRIPVIAMGEDDANIVPRYAKMVYPLHQQYFRQWHAITAGGKVSRLNIPDSKNLCICIRIGLKLVRR